MLSLDKTEPHYCWLPFLTAVRSATDQLASGDQRHYRTELVEIESSDITIFFIQFIFILMEQRFLQHDQEAKRSNAYDVSRQEII
jgi:hypothetical protein